jgi:hypothetical protein
MAGGATPDPTDGTDATDATDVREELSIEDVGVFGSTADENYGVLGTPSVQPYILVPTRIEMVDGVITTNSLMTPSIEDMELYGFDSQDPDNNPDTYEFASMGETGYRGEGARGGGGAHVQSAEDATNLTGEKQAAVQFDTSGGTQSLELSTMGIGYITLSTTFEDRTTPTKLFFNYSTIPAEPALAVNGTKISTAGTSCIDYFVENPIWYSEEESAAFRYKFGWDPTLTEGASTSAITNGLERSFESITTMLITNYPINLTTFPRTPFFRIRSNDISALTEDETAQTTTVAGTTATDYTSGMTTTGTEGGPSYG